MEQEGAATVCCEMNSCTPPTPQRDSQQALKVPRYWVGECSCQEQHEIGMPDGKRPIIDGLFN